MRNTRAELEHNEGMTLTFKAFLAASASDRLSKLTNPTGWGDKETEQKKETWFKAENWVGISVWVTKTCFYIYIYIYFNILAYPTPYLSASLSLSPVYKTIATERGGGGGGRLEAGRTFIVEFIIRLPFAQIRAMQEWEQACKSLVWDRQRRE